MASKRRGGFRPPELRGTLGTLIRTTTGVVRDALERGAREGRARIDDARAGRRRQDALADLGELVLDLIRRGEIDLAELPEAHDLVRQLDDLDADTDDPAPPPRASIRRRFDDRAHPDPGRDDGTVSSGISARAERTERPTAPERPERTERPTAPERPRSRPASSDRVTKPMKITPPRDPSPDDPDPAARTERPTVPSLPTLATGPYRKGGISFDDDDLNEYMHPDDVPPRGAQDDAPKDPDDHDA